MKILVMTPERIDKMIASARGDCKEARIINDLNNGVPKYRIALGAHQSRLAQLLELRAAMTEVDLDYEAAVLRLDKQRMFGVLTAESIDYCDGITALEQNILAHIKEGK